ncbi:GntR family transcriptional regulator [Rudanella paleaurantiibacter]|uniref:GntR family transcriptional regulator n=1 Tax=Rudanella paleaurantiibacter TaxID=2614655 RepID=A0A7J5TTD8_9BACT|nr:winged helix-turn-helix domain-containing protein [Rudanella paleaurantiibacter]KAB7727077.1 GntR family transcriptional regulator [Rudanella paleaurantiibacter]
MLNQIAINDFSSTPKYLQIVNSIIEGIEQNDILPGDKLPSIYEMCAHFEISKRTVERAYEVLKEKELIGGVQGKGFYIQHTKFGRTQKIFLLFNKLSPHKKIIYDAFVERLGSDVAIDFFIYNNDFRLFKNLLLGHAHGYTHYVIIPHFLDQSERAVDLINQLPKHKLIVLDKAIDGLMGQYGSVVQNFEKDLTQALTDALPLLRKYSTLNILFPAYSYYDKGILNGFYAFCHAYGFNARVVHEVNDLVVQPDCAYINLMEEDLVTLIKKTKDTAYQVGKEVGILSYNESPLKEVLLDGITVISTDHAHMGRTAADLILSDRHEHIENPFRLIVRRSL